MLVHRAYPGIDWCILAGNVWSCTQLQCIDCRPCRVSSQVLDLKQHSLKHCFHRLGILSSFLVQLVKFVFDLLEQSDSLVCPAFQRVRRNVGQQSIMIVQSEHYRLPGVQLEHVMEDLLLELVQSRNEYGDSQEVSTEKQ